MFFNFRFLITLHVANIICRDMVLRNKIPLMFIISQHKVTLLQLSSLTLWKFGTIISSTCYTLWRTALSCKCVTWVPYMSSSVPTSSRRIGKFCRTLLSTTCRYCSWFQVELNSTWNPHTLCIHGYINTETYPRLE